VKGEAYNMAADTKFEGVFVSFSTVRGLIRTLPFFKNLEYLLELGEEGTVQGGLAEVQNVAWGSLAISVAIMSEVALFIIRIHFTISGDRVLVLQTWDYSAWVCTYALYVEEQLEI